jgi:hypothetical protein
VGDALGVGVAEAVAAGTGPEAPAAEPAWPKYSARGTATMPTSTVRTKLTAPHSLTRKERFTKRAILDRPARRPLAGD